MPHITLLAYPGCSASGITGIIDALAMANLWHQVGGQKKKKPLFSWDIVSRDGKPLTGRNRIAIIPHGPIHGIDQTDILVLPAFQPPFDFLGEVPEEIQAWIRHWHARQALIATICTGTFFLAETGLLDGRTATTNWSFARFFKKRFPKVNLKPEQILTEDHGLVCSGASTAYLDLCLYLIETFGSHALADRCAKSMLAERHRSGQSPYVVFDYQKDHGDRKIMEAQAFMEDHFTETISLEELASALGISSRHFKRRFKQATGDTPLGYLQQIRIEAAKARLETTREAVNQITWQVGYEDSNSFRRLFKKHTGLSPRSYRERFTRTGGSRPS